MVGVAGLMFAANPSLTAANAFSYLKKSADDLGAPSWETRTDGGASTPAARQPWP